LNNHKIHVKSTDTLKQCVIGTGFLHNKDNVDYIVEIYSYLLWGNAANSLKKGSYDINKDVELAVF